MLKWGREAVALKKASGRLESEKSVSKYIREKRGLSMERAGGYLEKGRRDLGKKRFAVGKREGRISLFCCGNQGKM